MRHLPNTTEIFDLPIEEVDVEASLAAYAEVFVQESLIKGPSGSSGTRQNVDTTAGKYIHLDIGVVLDSGVAQYRIEKEISHKSAHSVAYLASVVTPPEDDRYNGSVQVVVKIPKVEYRRIGQGGGRYAIREQLEWCAQRFQAAYNERLLAFQLQECEFAYTVQDVFVPSSSLFTPAADMDDDLDAKLFRTLQFPVTVQQFATQKPLDQYCRENLASDDKGEFNGIAKPSDYLRLANAILRSVEDIHARGVLHNDLKPDNLYVDDTRKDDLADNPYCVYLIDFGNSRDKQSNNREESIVDLEDPAGEIAHRRRTFADPLGIGNVQSDVFSLGVVLLYLATGQSRIVVETDHEIVSRPGPAPDRANVLELIQNHNPNLARSAPVLVDVIARCLWCAPDHRFSSVDAIRRSLNAVEYLIDRDVSIQTVELDIFEKPEVRGAFMDSLTFLEEEATGPNRLLLTLAHERLIQWRRMLREARQGVFEFFGETDEVLELYGIMLGLTDKDSLLRTLSTERFWDPRNFGIRGRFLSMNEMAVCTGCTIDRVFVVRRRHVEIWEDFESRYMKGTDLTITSPNDVVKLYNENTNQHREAHKAFNYSQVIAEHLQRAKRYSEKTLEHGRWLVRVLRASSERMSDGALKSPISIITYAFSGDRDLRYSIQPLYGRADQVIGIRIKTMNDSRESNIADFERYASMPSCYTGETGILGEYPWLKRLASLPTKPAESL